MTITIKDEQGGLEEGTTMSVDRYGFWDTQLSLRGDGNYVLYTDYQKLEKENRVFRKALLLIQGAAVLVLPTPPEGKE